MHMDNSMYTSYTHIYMSVSVCECVKCVKWGYSFDQKNSPKEWQKNKIYIDRPEEPSFNWLVRVIQVTFKTMPVIAVVFVYLCGGQMSVEMLSAHNTG